MRRLIAVAATVLLAGCTSATAVSTQPGPLGGPDGFGGGICFGFYPGEVLTDGFVALTNSSRHPVRITGVRVTGLRHMRVDAVYAYVLANTGDGVGDGYGWPPASERHPAAGAVIPAAATEQVLTVVTALAPTAYAAGEDLSYASEGQSYTHVTTWFLGQSRTCPPFKIPRSQAKAVYEKVMRSKDPRATLRKLSEADLYLWYLATRITGMRGSSSIRLVSPPP